MKLQFLRACMPIDEITRHEFAHHFVAERENTLKTGRTYDKKQQYTLEYYKRYREKVTSKNEADLSTAVARKMIDEGIGEYYRKSWDNIPPYEPVSFEQMFSSEWNKRKVHVESPEYREGLYLVAPILRKHGARGIDLMITHKPTVKTMYELRDWQQEILAMW